MQWDRLEDIMVFVSFVVTLGVVAVFIYKRLKEYLISRRIQLDSTAEEIPQSIGVSESNLERIKQDTIHLYDLRQFRYRGFDDLEKLDFKAFFIDEDENEALAIFVSVSPAIITTLTKLEKALIHIDVSVSSEDVTDVEIMDKIKIINDSLSTLLDVTDNLTQKLYGIYSRASIETTERELNPEVVKAYIDIVNNLMGFAFDYLNVNNIIRLKVKEVHPHVERDFVRATERFLNIFFVDLMNCINMLDKSIEAYK